MTSSQRTSVSTADILASAALCAAAAVLVVATSALVVAVSGLAADTRRALGFSFSGLERSPAEVARLALHNSSLAAGTLACATARPRLRVPLRVAIDLVLAALLAVNAAVVGVA